MSESDTQHTDSNRDTSVQAADFSQRAEESSPGLIAEFWDFIVHNKKWWIAPIVIVFLLVGLLIFLAESPFGPMLYPLG